MNIFLWVVQGLLAIHTAIGAIWKFSHTAEQTMPSLKALPQGVWMSLAVLELLCALGLVVPAFSNALGMLAPLAAAVIAAEMLLFCGLHLFAGEASNLGPMIYWLIIAALCSFVAYGRHV